MVLIQLVTVEDCFAPCLHCDTAEAVLRSVLAVADIPFPEHEDGNKGEYLLTDGRTIEVVHLSPQEAERKGFRVEGAPYLFIDGKRIPGVAQWSHDALAGVVLDALFPHGLADLRQ